MLQEPAEVAFYYAGGLYWGSMVDLSICGARFVLHMQTEHEIPAFSKGHSLECCITTAVGTSKCRGVVQWTELHNGNLEWGLAFTDLPADEDDPLFITFRDYFKQEKNGDCRKLFR